LILAPDFFEHCERNCSASYVREDHADAMEAMTSILDHRKPTKSFEGTGSSRDLAGHV